MAEEYGSSVIKCKFDDISKFRKTSLIGGISGNSNDITAFNSSLYLKKIKFEIFYIFFSNNSSCKFYKYYKYYNQTFLNFQKKCLKILN